MDVRADAAVWLHHARECFGGDLPMRPAGSLPGPVAPGATQPRELAALPTARLSRTGAELSAAPPSARDTLATASAGPAEAAARPLDPGPTTPAVSQSEAPPTERLAALRAQAAACVRCKLSATRANVVFGEGSVGAQVMFIGEAPGFHEDQQGRPFVGAAGQLLDKIIENAMGLRRADTYIANINKCRPPENREPEPDEVAACIPFLREQVRILRPKVIVCLGRVASSNLLGTSLPMRALRGRELTYEGTPVVVTWHPAYLLRNPEAKRDTWEDVKRVNRLLGLPEDPRRG